MIATTKHRLEADVGVTRLERNFDVVEALVAPRQAMNYAVKEPFLANFWPVLKP